LNHEYRTRNVQCRSHAYTNTLACRRSGRSRNSTVSQSRQHHFPKVFGLSGSFSGRKYKSALSALDYTILTHLTQIKNLSMRHLGEKALASTSEEHPKPAGTLDRLKTCQRGTSGHRPSRARARTPEASGVLYYARNSCTSITLNVVISIIKHKL
jgi:hypothetical protein